MGYEDLKEFALKIKSKLYDEVNGRISFEIYEEQDAILFEINFKEAFTHREVISNIQTKMFKGVTSDQICNDILNSYKKQVLKAFFKSRYKKAKDAERKANNLIGTDF